jgi:hypothetical protein
MQNLSEVLEPIAAWFRNLGTPEAIVHWGHPVMMGIVVFVMGSYVGWTGWRSRTLTDADEVMKNRGEHRKIAPLMFLFLAMGYTGGILSLVMQHQPILESPHFLTGSAALVLLTINTLLSAVSFGGENKGIFRSIHAYVGSAVLILFIVHAVFGLKLGLSI